MKLIRDKERNEVRTRTLNGKKNARRKERE
jgi:hypothetical protein